MTEQEARELKVGDRLVGKLDGHANPSNLTFNGMTADGYLYCDMEDGTGSHAFMEPGMVEILKIQDVKEDVGGSLRISDITPSLTFRQYASVHILASMLSTPNPNKVTAERAIEKAVEWTDHLLAKLEGK